MSERRFNAPDGTQWTVWEVIPGRVLGDVASAAARFPEALLRGWLCFECAREKRRLNPVPEGWDARPDRELWLLCRVAEAVQRHLAAPAAVLGAAPA